MVNTTIKLNEKIKSFLDDIKVHPRETYAQVIERLIKFWKERKK